MTEDEEEPITDDMFLELVESLAKVDLGKWISSLLCYFTGFGK